MVKLKEILLDFLNYVFLLAIIVFCIIYFISGNRFQEFTEMLQKLLPLLIFTVIFLIKFKHSREIIKKYKKEANLDEVIIFFSKIDIIKDYIAAGTVPMLIIGIAVIDGNAGGQDIWQGLAGYSVMFIAHQFLFRKKDGLAAACYVTRLDKIIDEIIIFLLPIAVFMFAVFKASPDIIDLLQAILPFAAVYYWRKIQFKTDR